MIAILVLALAVALSGCSGPTSPGPAWSDPDGVVWLRAVGPDRIELYHRGSGLEIKTAGLPEGTWVRVDFNELSVESYAGEKIALAEPGGTDEGAR